MKEEVKVSLFSNGMISYMENPKTSTKKLLELVNEFSQVAGWIISIQKYLYFYRVSMNNLKVKLRKPSIYNSIKKRKIIWTNLTNEM